MRHLKLAPALEANQSVRPLVVEWSDRPQLVECHHGFTQNKCLSPSCANYPGGKGAGYIPPEPDRPTVRAAKDESIVGQRIGGLTVGPALGTRDRHDSPEHPCACDCGAKCVKSRRDLLRYRLLQRDARCPKCARERMNKRGTK
jgi:hypothetical protein